MDSEDDCVVSEGHLHPPGGDVTFFCFKRGEDFRRQKWNIERLVAINFLFCFVGDFLRILPGIHHHERPRFGEYV